ncbi:hypothetical protein [Serinicoccus sp. CNJ-927]|uniref:hypothetical protein n=1 Tax=Serinicoccus sp. CNJ-927 TaxID=1904970 RepID=UPI0011799D09|nr:hypothetical protein [Serinicoccus sp. CNJ-927]
MSVLSPRVAPFTHEEGYAVHGRAHVPGSGWSQSPVGIDASMAAICVRKVNQLGDLGIDLAEAAGEVLLGRLARAYPAPRSRTGR